MDQLPDNTPGQSTPPPASQQGAFASPVQKPATSTPPSGPYLASADQQAAGLTAAPSSDESSNELDQEWVRKAKSILEQTKDDPFQTSRELSKMKADYLKIRYNKHVKVTEDPK